MPLIMPSASL